MTNLTVPSAAPSADVIRDEGFIRIVVDVPGLEPTVAVHTRGHTVIVEGHRTQEPTGRYLLHERVGSFHREFVLPKQTDMRNLHGRIHDGVLTITALVGDGRTETGEQLVDVLPSAWACHPDAAAI